jgi:hypothetical protein
MEYKNDEYIDVIESKEEDSYKYISCKLDKDEYIKNIELLDKFKYKFNQAMIKYRVKQNIKAKTCQAIIVWSAFSRLENYRKHFIDNVIRIFLCMDSGIKNMNIFITDEEHQKEWWNFLLIYLFKNKNTNDPTNRAYTVNDFLINGLLECKSIMYEEYLQFNKTVKANICELIHKKIPCLISYKSESDNSRHLYQLTDCNDNSVDIYNSTGLGIYGNDINPMSRFMRKSVNAFIKPNYTIYNKILDTLFKDDKDAELYLYYFKDDIDIENYTLKKEIIPIDNDDIEEGYITIKDSNTIPSYGGSSKKYYIIFIIIILILLIQIILKNNILKYNNKFCIYEIIF